MKSIKKYLHSNPSRHLGQMAYILISSKNSGKIKKIVVTNTCTDAFSSATILDDLNKIFLTFIFKVHHLETIAQCRPIGLCNTIYKTITKTTINRIRTYLSTIISHAQSSFVPWRRVMDNVIIVQEAVHFFKK